MATCKMNAGKVHLPVQESHLLSVLGNSGHCAWPHIRNDMKIPRLSFRPSLLPQGRMRLGRGEGRMCMGSEACLGRPVSYSLTSL